MRSDEKPLRVESSSPGWFRAGANRSYPEGIRLLLCISTDGRLWRSPEGDLPNERRRKTGQTERPNREGHAVWAGPVKTFREVGDVKNDTADLWTKGNLRVKMTKVSLISPGNPISCKVEGCAMSRSKSQEMLLLHCPENTPSRKANREEWRKDSRKAKL